MIRTLLAAAAVGAITVGGAAVVSLGSSPVTSAANCPSGTYEIQAGTASLCRHRRQRLPSTPPPDATAVCVDGTYSYSKHVKGACSNHGGVDHWLIPVPAS